MPFWSSLRDTIIRKLYTFEAPRVLQVRIFKVGLIYRLVQLLILGYLIGFAIVYQKNYQETDRAVTSVTVKVKGTTSTINRDDIPQQYRRVWDTADYVIPAHETGGFFVLTNAILTPNQTMGTCAENPGVAPCSRDENICKEGIATSHGNGIMTGNCVLYDSSNHSCEIIGWCPVEKASIKLKPPLLSEAANFTVLIKNNIEFVKFRVERSNILPGMTREYLYNCTYNQKTDSHCPIFRLGDIVSSAGVDFIQLASKGGIIRIGIEWNCDLDYHVSYCVPIYKFGRLYSNIPISPGYNFRYAYYYRTVDGVEYRDLVKAYGIRFIFQVSATAGKFNFVRLLFRLGSGLAYFALASICCDFLLSHVFKKRGEYKRRKNLTLSENEELDDHIEEIRRADVAQVQPLKEGKRCTLKKEGKITT